MDRICAWTGGQPYLTQRVARGVARRGGRLEDVERARARTIAGARCRGKGSAARPCSRLARRSLRGRRGGRRSCCTGSSPAPRSRSPRMPRCGSGCGSRAPSASTAERKLGVRNRIVKELVAAGWLKQKSRRCAWLAAAAALLVVLAGGGYWYTQYLPVADIETLNSADHGHSPTVEEAYRRLRGLPGFARARRRAVARSAAAATAARRRRWLTRPRRTLGCASCRARTRRRIACSAISGCGARASRRTPSSASGDLARAARRGAAGGETWRRCRLPRRARRRRLRHSRAVAAARRRAAVLAHVFAQACGCVARRGAPSVAHAVRCRGRRRRLGAAPLKLTALEHERSTRELAVEGEGTAGELRAVADRAARCRRRAARDVDGAERRGGGARRAARRRRARRDVRVPSRAGIAAGPARRRRRARRLAFDDRRSRGRQHGRVRRLGPQLGDNVAARRSVRIASRFPIRSASRRSNVQAVADRAVAWPTAPAPSAPSRSGISRPGSSSTTTRLPAAPRAVALDAAGTRVLAATDRLLMLWNAPTARSSRASATQTEFVLPPVFSRGRRLRRDRGARRRRESAL